MISRVMRIKADCNFLKRNKKQRHKAVYDRLHDIPGKSGIKRVFIVEFHKTSRNDNFMVAFYLIYRKITREGTKKK